MKRSRAASEPCRAETADPDRSDPRWTGSDQDAPGLPLATVFDDVLRVPYTVGTAPFDFGEDRTPGTTFEGLTSLRSGATDAAEATYWLVAQTRSVDAGASQLTDTHKPPARC